MYPNSIIKKVGKFPGKTVAVFAGVHGNEKVGILALDKILNEVEIKSGTVYFVYANPPAIEKNIRAINKNLNRLFSRDNQGDTDEDKRASKLMDILDECEALLDVHSYNSKSGKQFAISEENGFEILKKMDFPIVVSGFSKLGNGTDAYMQKNGKIGICVECGTSNKPEKFLPLGEKSIYQFLQYFGCIENRVQSDNAEQKFLRVKKMINKKTDNFSYVKDFKDFEILPAGEVFAVDGSKSYSALENEYIIFPRPDVPVGGEAGIVAESV